MGDKIKHTPGPWRADSDAGWFISAAPGTAATTSHPTDSLVIIDLQLRDDATVEADAYLIAASPLLCAALRAQDDLDRLRWIRDNSFPDEIGCIYADDITEILERNKDVITGNDSWGWIIAKMEPHVADLREQALAAVEGETP